MSDKICYSSVLPNSLLCFRFLSSACTISDHSMRPPQQYLALDQEDCTMKLSFFNNPSQPTHSPPHRSQNQETHRTPTKRERRHASHIALGPTPDAGCHCCASELFFTPSAAKQPSSRKRMGGEQQNMIGEGGKGGQGGGEIKKRKRHTIKRINRRASKHSSALRLRIFGGV